MISYRNLVESDLSRLAEINRAEVIRIGYEVHDGNLVKKEVEWNVRNFFSEGEGEHTVARQINACRNLMARNAISVGAFDDGVLAGIGILTLEIRPGMAQLAYLQISAPNRRKGIGSEITRQLLDHARAKGSNRIYVSATPSESAVGFYRSFGFDLVEEPLPELFELEPEDIHMVLELDAAEDSSPA